MAIHHAEVLTAPGLCDFHNALREIAIADTDLFDLWDLANEVGGYEDDRLSCGVGDHLLNVVTAYIAAAFAALGHCVAG